MPVVGVDAPKPTPAVGTAQDRQDACTVANTGRAIRKPVANLPSGTLVIRKPTGGHEAPQPAELAVARLAVSGQVSSGQVSSGQVSSGTI